MAAESPDLAKVPFQTVASIDNIPNRADGNDVLDVVIPVWGVIMDISMHDMRALFLQLGLPNAPEDVQAFLQAHEHLSNNVPLPLATFWSPSQAAFLREAIEDDSDWSEIVDELDNLLRG